MDTRIGFLDNSWQFGHVAARWSCRLGLAMALLAVFSQSAAAVDTTWTLNGDGLWTNAAAWNNGEPTNSTFNVFIDDGDSAVTVTLNASRSIGDLTLESNDTLRFNNGLSLTLAGDVANNGVISLLSSGANTDFVVSGGTHNLTGTGILRLGGAGQDRVRGSGTLVNGSMHTIEGWGSLGVEETNFTNQMGGVIDANVNTGVLLVDPETSLANQGTMQASGGGVLRLTGIGAGAFNNSGGTIQAIGAGSRVELIAGAAVSAGTLRTSGGGRIQVNSGNSATVTGFTLAGDLVASDNSTLNIGGTITNQVGSTIKVEAGASTTSLRLTGATTLQGGGRVQLSQSGGASALFGSAGTLTNVDNRIEGYGLLGNEEIDFVNQSAGVIDANVNTGILEVDPENSFVNQGTMQASGGGVLRLTGIGAGAFNNSGGTIQAIGAGSRVELIAGAAVSAGTLRTSGGGRIQVNSGNSATVTGFTLAGDLVASDNSTLNIGGTITNQVGSTIKVEAGASTTSLRLTGATTLQGGGRVLMSQTGGGGLALFGSAGTLTNVDNRIEGYGLLGNEEIDFVNQSAGVIDANVNTGILEVDPENSFVNQGTMQASGGGVLRFTGIGGGDFNNSGGTIQAIGAGSRVELIAGAAVSAGTLRTNGGGRIQVNSGNSATVTGFTLAGDLVASDNSTLNIGGTITNQVGSTIKVEAGASAASLRLIGATTLQGGGRVLMSQTGGGGLALFGSAGTLTNVDNRIEGYGLLGNEEIDFVNQSAGVIDANVNTAILEVDPENSFVNQGTMQASGGGVLRLTGNGGGNFNNSGGRLRVESVVELASAAAFSNLTGGRVEGTGTFRTTGGTFANVSGVVAPGNSIGRLTIQGGMTQNAQGSLEIDLAGPTPGTEHDQLVVTGNASLNGILDVNPGGTVVDPAVPGTIDQFAIMTYGSHSGAFSTLDYAGDVFTPDFAGGVFYVGQSGTSNLDGMFRRIEYQSNQVVFSNYLALPGDADGNRTVDGNDFIIWNAHKFTSGNTWITGDFTGDGITDGLDFIVWNAHKFTSAGSVPEPALGGWLALMLIMAQIVPRSVPRQDWER